MVKQCFLWPSAAHFHFSQGEIYKAVSLMLQVIGVTAIEVSSSHEGTETTEELSLELEWTGSSD